MATEKSTILIVDDLPENREILLLMLEPKGYATLVAEDGPSALRLAREAQPDLILLDIMMPGMDGFEVCRQLTADPLTADIPVIFLSALHDLDYKVKGFEAGGVDYVSKPYWHREVLARVDAHVRLRAAQKEREAVNARLRLEIEQRKAAEQALEEANHSLSQANRRLQDLAAEDGLTGIANRRRLDEHLAMSWAQSVREGMPLSVVLSDVDCFKTYNDHYGHQAGDEVLRRVAQAIRGALKRPADLAGRYGGEEFLVILFNTDPAGAMVVAQEIRDAVRELSIPHKLSSAGPYVSVSLGVGSAMPGRSKADSAALIALADEALYEAKRGGRARIEQRHYLSSGVG